MPLLLTSAGAKLGKSEGNGVWMDAQRTRPVRGARVRGRARACARAFEAVRRAAYCVACGVQRAACSVWRVACGVRRVVCKSMLRTPTYVRAAATATAATAAATATAATAATAAPAAPAATAAAAAAALQYELYQHLLRTADADVGALLLRLTLLPEDAVAEEMRAHAALPERRGAQRLLAGTRRRMPRAA